MRDHDLLRCDHCERTVGRWLPVGSETMDTGAGYVSEVAKVTGIMCGVDGAHPMKEYPLACSDVCEDALLRSWPRVPDEMHDADEWGPDFRDSGPTSDGDARVENARLRAENKAMRAKLDRSEPA